MQDRVNNVQADSVAATASDLEWDPDKTPFELATLQALYRTGRVAPADVVRAVYQRISSDARPEGWIFLRPEAESLAAAKAIGARPRGSLPLYGIPFAVKDNIDVVGCPTTAACPAFAYQPTESALCGARLESAGAICIGKTNLDQFATGLSGVRSPYGACGSAYDRSVIAGGSSSGSAVVVALGQVCFALGTDTGGSGRVPAAFNNIVGLKPTIGVISTRGLVPNCRSLDCVSVFARSVPDALAVAETMRSFDAGNPFSRRAPPDCAFCCSEAPSRFRFGVPRASDLEFFGNAEAAQLFKSGVAQLEQLGGDQVAIAFEPFREAGRLLFDGPWIAERAAAVGGFVASRPESVLPVTRGVIESAARWSAADAFSAHYKLNELKRQVEVLFEDIDLLAVPTVGTWYTIADMAADPIARNTNLGYYSYGVNLLDLCALAVPSGFYRIGIPAGMTLIAAAFQDARCAAIGQAFEASFARMAPASGLPAASARLPRASAAPDLVTRAT
jgi:allophanate hydrolase